MSASPRSSKLARASHRCAAGMSFRYHGRSPAEVANNAWQVAASPAPAFENMRALAYRLEAIGEDCSRRASAFHSPMPCWSRFLTVDPVAAASVSDNLTDAWVAASRPLASRPNGRVLVVGGTESLGILAVQMARAAGADHVDYFDDNDARNKLARRSGATLRCGPDTDLHENYDIVIAATRAHDKLRTSLLALRTGGHCSCIGIIFDDPPFHCFRCTCATSHCRSDCAVFGRTCRGFSI
jgi:hypothetical protein